MMQHTKALSDLFENGDKLLVSFNTKNASLLEKLELLLLRFETSDTEQHTMVKYIRDKLVGEAHSYQGDIKVLFGIHTSIVVVVVVVIVVVHVVAVVIPVVDPRNIPLKFGKNPVINR